MASTRRSDCALLALLLLGLPGRAAGQGDDNEAPEEFSSATDNAVSSPSDAHSSVSSATEAHSSVIVTDPSYSVSSATDNAVSSPSDAHSSVSSATEAQSSVVVTGPSDSVSRVVEEPHIAGLCFAPKAAECVVQTAQYCRMETQYANDLRAAAAADLRLPAAEVVGLSGGRCRYGFGGCPAKECVVDLEVSAAAVNARVLELRVAECRTPAACKSLRDVGFVSAAGELLSGAPPEGDSDGFPWWWVAAGAAALFLAGAVLMFLAKRREPPAEDAWDVVVDSGFNSIKDLEDPLLMPAGPPSTGSSAIASAPDSDPLAVASNDRSSAPSPPSSSASSYYTPPTPYGAVQAQRASPTFSASPFWGGSTPAHPRTGWKASPPRAAPTPAGLTAALRDYGPPSHPPLPSPPENAVHITI